MTLKIETHSDGNKLTLCLTGRMKEECLEELQALLDNATLGAVLNLGDVSLVGVEVVRFLANCENAGVELVDCSPYIRDWINRERNKTKKADGLTRGGAKPASRYPLSSQELRSIESGPLQ